MSNLKLGALVALVLGSLWVGYKLAPEPKATIVYQDRVVVKEVLLTKEVARNVTKTTTLPDGTKVVEVDRSTEKVDVKEHTSDVDKSRQVVTVSNPTKYSLGISYRPDDWKFQGGVYTAEAGVRILASPLWLTTSFNTKKEVTVGVRIQW